MEDTSKIGTSAVRRSWVARVDAAVHAAFLVVAAFAIWQSQVLTVLWDYLRH